MVFSSTISLEDKVSPEAKKAANELNILSKTLLQTQNALVKAQATGDVKGFKTLTQKAANLEASISLLPKAAEKVTPSLTDMAGSSAAAESEMAALTGGLSAAVAVIAAVGAALGAVIFKMAEFAIEASEAKSAAISTWNALGQGVISGGEVDDMLDGLKSKLGITKDQLGQFTTQFMKMGINSKEALSSLTTAAVSAEAITKGAGDGFAALFQKVDAAAASSSKNIIIPAKGLQKQLVAAGLNISDMAKQMGMSEEAFSSQMSKGGIDANKFGDALQNAVTKKGAGALDNLANSSANLKSILQENIGDMFEDLGDIIKPFMKEVKDLFNIFQKDAPSAKTATSAIRGILTQVFAVATKIVPVIKHFLLDMVIYGLKAYIAFKPIVKTVKEFINSATGMAIISAAFSGLWTVIKLIAGVVLGVVAVFVTLWAIQAAMVVTVYALIGAFTDLVVGAGAALMDWIGGAASMASDFVKGLIEGISNGASAVFGAVKGLADGATNAFKSALGIASPSKEMMKLGGFTGQGFAEGVSATTGDVASASEGLAATASEGLSGAAPGGGAAAPAAAAAPAGGGGGCVVTATINFNGPAKGAEELTEQAVSLIFERMALEQGL